MADIVETSSLSTARHVRVVILVLFLLAACGQPEASRLTPSPTPTTAPVATATPLPAPTTAPTATLVPTRTPAPEPLTVWAAGDETHRDALIRLLMDAAAEAGVPIRINAASSDAMIATVRVAQLDGRPSPDVFWGTGDDLAILRTSGLIQPIQDATLAQQVLPATIAGATDGDQQWGVPIGAQGFLLLFYNRQLVTTAPGSMDALIATARAQTGGGTYGLVAGWVEARWFALWLDMTGGEMLDDTGMPSLDTTETMAALELLRTLRRYGPTPPSTYDAGARLFRRGRAALAIDGDWALESYRHLTGTLDLGIAPLPLASNGRPAAAPLTGVYLMYGAALDGARLAQAEQLAETLTGARWQARIARDLGMLPAITSILVDPAVAADPALAAAASYAARAPGIPPTRTIRCAWDAVEIALPPFLLGQRTAAETATAMQRRALACATQ